MKQCDVKEGVAVLVGFINSYHAGYSYNKLINTHHPERLPHCSNCTASTHSTHNDHYTS